MKPYLLSDDRTSLALLSGLPDWDAHTIKQTLSETIDQPLPPSIVEATFPPEDQKLIDELKAAVQTAFDSHQTKLSNESNHQTIKHWRDIYNDHKHRTNIQVTPDPRLAPNYKPILTAPLFRYDEWLDHRYYQFLIARKRSVSLACSMIIDYCDWYEQFGVADLTNQSTCPFADSLVQFWPERLHGWTRDGLPLIINTPGLIDMDTYHSLHLPVEVCSILTTYEQECFLRSMIEASHLAGRRIWNFYVIYDVKGFHMSIRGGLPWIQAQAAVAERYYPETLRCCLLPHAPSWFHIIWTIVKGFLDENTLNKLRMPKADFHQILNEVIAPEHIPAEYGGACKRCNGQCLPIQKRRDVAHLKAEQQNQVLLIEKAHPQPPLPITIAARDSYEMRFPLTDLELDIATDGSNLNLITIWWSIEVMAKDIDLSVSLHRDHDASSIELVDVQRIQHLSNGEKHRGMYQITVCSKDDFGTVVVKLSNHYSLFSSKQITVQAGLVKSS